MRNQFAVFGAALIVGLWMHGPAHSQTNIEWGDNTSEWANDGECDDPRFAGPGAAETLLDEDRYHDGNDCRRLYQEGRLYLRDDSASSRGDRSTADRGSNVRGDSSSRSGPTRGGKIRGDSSSRDGNSRGGASRGGSSRDRGSRGGDSVYFGDNSSEWANDGECDDPRFAGPGMAEILLDEDLFADANDCRRLYQEGRIRLATGGNSIDYGDNSSEWANDGECDDPRFEGPGMHGILLDEDMFADANDCRELHRAGRIRLR